MEVEVKWRFYPSSENTWETLESVGHGSRAIRTYLTRVFRDLKRELVGSRTTHHVSAHALLALLCDSLFVLVGFGFTPTHADESAGCILRHARALAGGVGAWLLATTAAC